MGENRRGRETTSIPPPSSLLWVFPWKKFPFEGEHDIPTAGGDVSNPTRIKRLCGPTKYATDRTMGWFQEEARTFGNLFNGSWRGEGWFVLDIAVIPKETSLPPYGWEKGGNERDGPQWEW
eukprot:CAMPEP_0184687992 /NCGR_PEP_ID=MMETSP0312-20130426/28196_1 /TAXON_ID=31354 /ORGANISM="Compsopogon coeruleus, Strain SAG 36.94" /LENGTH=120 /DNA_ID=CAMNT_0027144665 /DNA_START=1 /DNA_END=360 /DNA_ORIENTATION=-